MNRRGGGGRRRRGSVLRRGVALRARTGRDLEHPLVAALDRAAEELIERIGRGESTMQLAVGGELLTLDLAGWEQAIHTPALALATMLHVAAAFPEVDCDAFPADTIGPFYHDGEIITKPLDLGPPYAKIPDGPGLGVELDEAALAKFRVK